MMLEIQHQGVPERLLKIIRNSAQMETLHFQFGLFQIIFSFTLNINYLGSNSLALSDPQFHVSLISVAEYYHAQSHLDLNFRITFASSLCLTLHNLFRYQIPWVLPKQPHTHPLLSNGDTAHWSKAVVLVEFSTMMASLKGMQAVTWE